MQLDPQDVNVNELSADQINEMEERRIAALNDAGINEQEVLEKANENFNTWNSYFNENITRGKDDVNFCVRDQWTAVERSEFTRLFKPAMTMNKVYPDVKKIAGEQRKNKPDLLVRSLTGRATQEQLNLRSDLVRTIAYQSQTDLVYQTAFKSALMMSFGAFQVGIDYESPKSFRKMIKYDIITDPTTCSWDPTALKPHKGDGNWCGRRYIFTRDEFLATYPYVTNPISYIDPYMLQDFQWTTKDTITVADFFIKEWRPVILYQLSNGESVYDYEWDAMQKNFKEAKQIADGSIISRIIEKDAPRIIAERQSQDYTIMHYRLIRNQIIDFSVWPSKQLPIIFVDGDSYYIEGRQYTKSFIHEQRDAQKLLNYARSELAAELKNRRREQWIGTPDNIIGNEQMWRNPETQNGILIARPDPKTGAMPQKMQAWEVSQGIFGAAQSATQDMREISGFSETEQLQGRDMSGKARRERKLEGSMSAYIYFDNLNQSIAQGARVANDLLDYIIGVDENGKPNEREMVVKRKDGNTQNIIINERLSDNKLKNELVTGDFDIEIDTGPSFAVQKEMALEFMSETLQAYPQAFPLIADLWARNLDVQFMPQMAERFKTLVPPQILAKEQGQEPPPQQPSPQEQMMQAEIQLKQQQLQERAEELQIRRKKHQLEEAELIMQAKEIAQKSHIDMNKQKIDMHKAELDFTSKIAGILSDVHKHHNPIKRV